jgi:hypothetical protein
MKSLRANLTGLKEIRRIPPKPARRFNSMKFGTFTKYLLPSTIAALAVSLSPSSALAQDGHSHPSTAPQSLTQQIQGETLVAAVHDAISRFQDVGVAIAEGYALQFGCVSGSDAGAMGLHYVKGKFLDDEIALDRPEIVLYEQLPNGQLQLTGADYLVDAHLWNKKHKDPPQLMGQLFHLFDSPNRFGLPAFYTLHVWAWKENPNGAFTNWNPTVSCEAFTGQN